MLNDLASSANGAAFLRATRSAFACPFWIRNEGYTYLAVARATTGAQLSTVSAPRNIGRCAYVWERGVEVT